MSQKVQFILEAIDNATKELNTIREGIDDIGEQGKTTQKEIAQAGDGMSSSIGKTSKSFWISGEAIVSSLKYASVAVGTFALSMAWMGLASGKDVEKTRIAFENLYGSAERAGSMMMKITDFANKTPFEFGEIADMALKLKNVAGVTDEQLIPSLTNLGDIASSQGKPISQAVEAFNDAITGEFERLKEFGIVAKSNGDKVALTFRGQTVEVKKTSEGIGDYLKWIGQMAGIAGSMDKQSASLDGRLSTLKDTFMGLAREIVGVSLTGEVIKGGLFDTISTGVASAITMITEHKDTILGIFGIIGDVVSSVASGVVVLFGAAQAVLQTFGTWLSTNFGAQFQELGAVIGALFATIKQLFQSFGWENKPILDAFLFLMKATWETIKLVTESTIGALIEIVKVGITLIKDTIAIVMAVLHGDWAAAWEWIKTLFVNFMGGLLSVFIELFQPFYDQWVLTWEAIKLWWDGLIEGISLKWSETWNGIATTATGIWNGIKATATTIFTAIGTFLSGMWDSISTTAINKWNGLKDGVIGIWKSLTSWFSGDGSTTFTATFTSMLSTVTGAAKSIFNATIGIIEDFINRAIDGINSLIRAANKVSPMWIGEIGRVSIPRFAHGGLVEGPGGLDKVPAMLTAGEVVLNASQQGNVARAIEWGNQKGGWTIVLENNNFYGSDDEFAQKIGDTVLDIFKYHTALQS